MKRKPAEREEAGLWLDDSIDSLKVAEQNFELSNYHVCVFFIHSAIEKALKSAVIVMKSRAPPKTHSLKRLYREVAGEIRLTEEQVDFLGELTPAHQIARYVDIAMALPREIYSKRIAERYLSLAKPILDAVWGKLRT